MHHPVIRFLAPIVVGAALGAVWGQIGSCTTGACPLTATWWRGALYGGVLGLFLALSGRTS
ncbi:MAG: hypothetical protein JSR48_12545 [Verrucomicrobia bacterium]|nr:hypothetical protein [Verrucomicrobiota bacterium]